MLFYEAHSSLVESVREYVAGALRTGEAAVVIVTEPHRRAIDALLSQDVADLAAARARGQYVALDAPKTLARFMRDGRPDHDLFRTVVGGVIDETAGRYPRIAAFGEMVGLLVEAGDPQGALALEGFWNELQADRPVFSLLCGYSRAQLASAPSATGDDICATHNGRVPDGTSPSGRSLEPLEITQALVRSAPSQPQSLDFFIRVGAEFGLTPGAVAASLRTLEAAGEARRDRRGRWRRARES